MGTGRRHTVPGSETKDILVAQQAAWVLRSCRFPCSPIPQRWPGVIQADTVHTLRFNHCCRNRSLETPLFLGWAPEGDGISFSWTVKASAVGSRGLALQWGDCDFILCLVLMVTSVSPILRLPVQLKSFMFYSSFKAWLPQMPPIYWCHSFSFLLYLRNSPCFFTSEILAW